MSQSLLLARARIRHASLALSEAATALEGAITICPELGAPVTKAIADQVSEAASKSASLYDHLVRQSKITRLQGVYRA